MNYREISSFGNNKCKRGNCDVDPVSYCVNDTINTRFLHGTSGTDHYGQFSIPCQAYLSNRCANKWDEICEYASKNNNNYYPNAIDFTNSSLPYALNGGEILIRNTAINKYLLFMKNATKRVEQLDANVANSPYIEYWIPVIGTKMYPIYSIENVENLNNDIVMNKLIVYPHIAPDIINNIYNTMKKQQRLYLLEGTNLGNFYQTHGKSIQSVDIKNEITYYNIFR